jgi:hypothetical protein
MIDLTVVVPVLGETALATPLLPRLATAVAALGCRAELLVVQAPGEPPVPVPAGVPLQVVVAPRPGYGGRRRMGAHARH